MTKGIAATATATAMMGMDARMHIHRAAQVSPLSCPCLACTIVPSAMQVRLQVWPRLEEHASKVNVIFPSLGCVLEPLCP
jgi:hypothetical protein